MCGALVTSLSLLQCRGRALGTVGIDRRCFLIWASSRQKKRVYLVFFSLPLAVRARHFQRDEREKKEKKKTSEGGWGGGNLNNQCQSQDLRANPKNTQTRRVTERARRNYKYPRPHFQQRFPAGRAAHVTAWMFGLVRPGCSRSSRREVTEVAAPLETPPGRLCCFVSSQRDEL